MLDDDHIVSDQGRWPPGTRVTRTPTSIRTSRADVLESEPQGAHLSKTRHARRVGNALKRHLAG